ncbi:MAG: membrane protein insertase YidC [Acidiferrobacterales bacterium]|nr:membrane protein insertase YidC [Acidiferrobacterales bacterium]
MDFRRIILFGALGLVIAMIWQSWVQFQIDHDPANPASPAAQRAAANPSVADDVPSAPAVSTSDVPEATNVEEAAPSDGSVAEQGRIINVKTDFVDASISTRGGDIVQMDLVKHPVSVEQPDQGFTLLYKDGTGLNIVQNGLIGSDRDYPNHNVEFTSDQTEVTLDGEGKAEVVLNWTAPDGVDYQKVYTFRESSYQIDVEFRVANQSATDWTGFFYGQLKQTEVVQEGSMGWLGRLPSYGGAAIYTAEDKYDKVDYSEIRDGPLNLATSEGWVAMLQHYFVSAWLPSGSSGYQLYSGVSRNTLIPEYRIGFKHTEPVSVPAGQSGVLKSSLFVGPKEQKYLNALGVPGIALTVDYGWLTPVAEPLFWLLTKIHSFVGNWGWAIILLTVLVKAVFLPLSAASYKSMAKMKKLQPRLKTLKERYGEDKQKFQQEMMKLYKTEKVNPAGGCLPILVQIPVFIALYWVLLESVELRQADFMLWLNDLSLPDPYYVLPIIMGASMLAQQLLNPAPLDPLQKKIMTALPVVFTVFFLWFPAGLVLYWVVNNLLSIAQQYFITKKYENA